MLWTVLWLGAADAAMATEGVATVDAAQPAATPAASVAASYGAASDGKPLSADAVVASRGGAEITLQEIDARMAQMPAEIRAGYMDDPERIEQLILNMLLEKQLALMGREAGLDKKPLFDLQIQQAANRLLGSQAIEHHVRNLPEPDFEQLALERYTADPTSYAKAEQLKVTQILVKSEGRGADSARIRAEQARTRALAGEDFDALVKEYNEGNPPNGEISGVVRGQMVKPFETAVFALEEPGDISEVVETRFGFHVVRLDQRTPASRPPFSAVRDVLVKKLREEHRERERLAIRGQLNSMKISADPDTVASLRTRYLPGNSPIKDDAGSASAD